ncbi:hypothetical protein [Streptomyces sp. NPDC048142]|uniref:hypothetical protein n=1 Tax=Streptomyces sp. NPDC048142 TaxID=3365501 RepID=UPI00371C5B16
MAGRRLNFGRCDANGVQRADALGIAIKNVITGIASPVDTERGPAVRLRHLTTTDAGYEAMDRAGASTSRHSRTGPRRPDRGGAHVPTRPGQP